jgi:hypothetical protein
MFTSAADHASVCLVGLHSGESSNDADYEKALSVLEALNRRPTLPAIVGAILFVVDEGDHRPGSKWRRRIATLRKVSRPHRLAFITESSVTRGIITAIDWLQPPNAEQQVKAWTTIEDGIAWLERERHEPLPILRELYEIARRAGRPVRAGASVPRMRA